MFNFFTTIFNFLSTAVSYIVNLLKQIVQIITYAVHAVGQLFVAIAWLPAYVKVAVTSLISIGIIFWLLGRD